MENPTVIGPFPYQWAGNAGVNVFFVISLKKLSKNRIDAKQY